MKDEKEKELADKSAFEYFDKAIELVDVQKIGLYKEGFLEGLKAGRPQWHKVADGDLPKDEDWKWCVSYRGYYYVAKYEEMFGCWTNQEYSEVMQPYAWCEIPTFDKE